MVEKSNKSIIFLYIVKKVVKRIPKLKLPDIFVSSALSKSCGQINYMQLTTKHVYTKLPLLYFKVLLLKVLQTDPFV